MSDVREPAVEFRGLRMVFKRRRAEPLVAINQLDLRIGSPGPQWIGKDDGGQFVVRSAPSLQRDRAVRRD